MSETYTTGLNDWVHIGPLIQEGVVFTPKETHTLNFIDLELRVAILWFANPLEVYKCDPDGQPTGDRISWSVSYWFQKQIILLPQRVRFRMRDTLLTAGERYIIVLKSRLPLPPGPDWGNDKDDQTYYPRGWRMSHLLGAPTWTAHIDECHIFAEFGEPPLPKPEPPPPIDNFAVLDLIQTRLPDGIRITLATATPCHLTCYWTDKQPLKHPTTRIVRGLEVPWATYFCFVAWHAVEQIEPGDTLYHTFDLTNWLFCETRWLTFRGVVDDVQSPSVGPIFKKHNDFIPYTRYEYYIAATNAAFPTNGTKRLAQTFTPLLPHTITQVVLPLAREGLPGTITVAIEGTTPTGRPNDVILTSSTFDGNDLPLLGVGATSYTIIPIDPHDLTPGVMYATVIFRGLPGTRLHWDAQDGNPYPRGRAWAWVTGPDRWTSLLTFDMLFEEWGLEL